MRNVKTSKKAVVSKPVVIVPAVKAETPAKPAAAVAPKPVEKQTIDYARERAAATAAIAQYYNGASKPFKAIALAGSLSPLNFDNQSKPTQRTAALLVCLLTYGDIATDGTFKRGAFNVPASLAMRDAKPGDTVRAMPESGCLGNVLARSVAFVSGARDARGKAQAEQMLRIIPAAAIAEITSQLGTTDLTRAALAKLAKLAA